MKQSPPGRVWKRGIQRSRICQNADIPHFGKCGYRVLKPCLVLSLFVAVVGCGESAGTAPGVTGTVEPTPQTDAAEPEDSASEASTETQKVDLEICSYEELLQRVASHQGKIVVVDFWSTQCPPCMEEFPHLVALSRKYPADQVVCISASLDFEDFGANTVESAREHALEFLTQQQATLTNVILNVDSIVIQETKLGTGIPVVVLYDTDGAEKSRFDESLGEPFSYEKNVIPAVDQLVKERFGTEAQ